jgi:hypothetical protein
MLTAMTKSTSTTKARTSGDADAEVTADEVTDARLNADSSPVANPTSTGIGLTVEDRLAVLPENEAERQGVPQIEGRNFGGFATAAAPADAD